MYLPIIHDVSLASCFYYDMYLKMAGVEIDDSWKDPTHCDLLIFRKVLSVQMFKYNPVHMKYGGGTRMQLSSQQNCDHTKRFAEYFSQSRKSIISNIRKYLLRYICEVIQISQN